MKYSEQDEYLYRIGALFTDTIPYSADYGISIDITHRLVDVSQDIRLQDLYSYLRNMWANEELISYHVPMVCNTPNYFEFVNNWSLTQGSIQHLQDNISSVEGSTGEVITFYNGESNESF